jgi:hypothetical protein
VLLSHRTLHSAHTTSLLTAVTEMGPNLLMRDLVAHIQRQRRRAAAAAASDGRIIVGGKYVLHRKLGNVGTWTSLAEPPTDTRFHFARRLPASSIVCFLHRLGRFRKRRHIHSRGGGRRLRGCSPSSSSRCLSSWLAHSLPIQKRKPSEFRMKGPNSGVLLRLTVRTTKRSRRRRRRRRQRRRRQRQRRQRRRQRRRKKEDDTTAGTTTTRKSATGMTTTLQQ